MAVWNSMTDESTDDYLISAQWNTLDNFPVPSYYYNTMSDCKKASFPPKGGNEAFDPYSDPDCENSLWKQWR